MVRIKYLVLLINLCLEKTHAAYNFNDLSNFLNDFLHYEDRPSIVVSHLNLSKKEHVQLFKSLSANNKQLRVGSGTTAPSHSDVIHLADCNGHNTWLLLQKAIEDGSIKSPTRWLLLLEDVLRNDTNSTQNSDYRSEIEHRLKPLYIDMSSEVYIAIHGRNVVELFSVYKIKPQYSLTWEELGTWSAQERRFDQPAPAPVAARRRDLRGAPVVAATVILDDRSTMEHMQDYLHRETDTLTKLMFYMVRHLTEWVNGTGVVNRTRSWGYKQPDGRYDGVVRELHEGRADLAGTLMLPSKERTKYMKYVLVPAPVEADFIFKKPALASVTNIYVLPFSIGVWIFIVILIIASSFTLFLAYCREDVVSLRDASMLQKLSAGIFDTLCLVFQQGTAFDPISIAGRQILLLGLMAFMFLFTAYSANVVALLQSTTNDINSVEALLASPLACGSQDVLYNRQQFLHETRPIHRALSTRKVLPQGEKAYLSVEEGIRKVREGMYAFHVELTAGYDQVQRTFQEDEKCNLGAVKYINVYPYLALAHGSHIKEQLRIGAIRIMESGVQRRTVRRMLPGRPRCGAGAAVFAAVRLRDVAPALRCVGAAAALAPALLAAECLCRRVSRKKKERKAAIGDTGVDEVISENVDYNNKADN